MTFKHCHKGKSTGMIKTIRAIKKVSLCKTITGS